MKIRGIASLSLYTKGPLSLRMPRLPRLPRLEAHKPLFLILPPPFKNSPSNSKSKYYDTSRRLIKTL